MSQHNHEPHLLETGAQVLTFEAVRVGRSFIHSVACTENRAVSAKRCPGDTGGAADPGPLMTFPGQRVEVPGLSRV